MNRRGFLGSVLGVVAGSSFLVKSFEQPIQRIVLPDYRMYFRESGDLLIQAPGVQKIEEIENGFRWIAEPLDVQRTITMRSVALYNSKGQLIMESRFSHDVPMYSGDQLKCQQSLTIDGRVKLKGPEHLAALLVATGGKGIYINDPRLKEFL